MLIKSHSLMQHLKPRFLLLDIKIGPREQQRPQRPILIIFIRDQRVRPAPSALP